jgi:hypothetical protein
MQRVGITESLVVCVDGMAAGAIRAGTLGIDNDLLIVIMQGCALDQMGDVGDRSSNVFPVPSEQITMFLPMQSSW